MRILFLNIPAAGHINPTLPIVRELSARGHQVYYANAPGFGEVAEQAGAVFLPYAGEKAFRIPSRLGNFARLASLLQRHGLRLVRRHLEEYRRLAPDAVVFDSLAVWGPVIADLLGVPGIGSYSIFVYDRRRMSMQPAFTLRLAGMAARSLKAVAAAAAAQQRLRALSPNAPALMDSFKAEGAENLVYTVRELQPSGGVLPGTFHFVGPIVDWAADAEPLGGALHGAAPVVYIALGSLFSRTSHAPRRLSGFYQACVDAFAGTERTAVIAAGDFAGSLSIPDGSTNIIVGEWLPQPAVLRRAALFITHGGMNSVHEALSLGVPLVLVPQQAEQEAVAAQVQARGAGVSLGRGPYTAAQVRRAAELVLGNQAFRDAAQSLAQQIQAAGGREQAAEIILRAAAEKG